MSRRALAACGVAVVVLVAAACSSSNPPNRPAAASSTTAVASGDPAGVRALVAIVGDSNISLGGRWLVWDMTRGRGGLLTADHLDDNYVPMFVARAGAGLRTADCAARDTTCPTHDFWAKKLGATFARARPDAIVTNLGVNDAFERGTASGPGYAGYDDKIDAFMKLVPRSTPVLWTNLPCAIEPPSVRTGCDTINRALAAAPARWHSLTIVDWASAAGNRASYIDRNAPPGYRVHYTDAGYAAWAALVTRALDARFPAGK